MAYQLNYTGDRVWILWHCHLESNQVALSRSKSDGESLSSTVFLGMCVYGKMFDFFFEYQQELGIISHDQYKIAFGKCLSLLLLLLFYCRLYHKLFCGCVILTDVDDLCFQSSIFPPWYQSPQESRMDNRINTRLVFVVQKKAPDHLFFELANGIMHYKVKPLGSYLLCW